MQTQGLSLRLGASEAVVAQASRWMAASNPWRELGIDEARTRAALSDPERELWVGWEDEAPVAVAVIDRRGVLSDYLQTLCVSPERRGAGVGAWLLGAIEARVFARSPNLFLCVSSFNEGAQRFYARRGYAVVGRLEGFITEAHDELLMRKTRGSWQAFREAREAMGR